MDELDRLTTEARNPASANLDQLSALEIVQLINREDARIAEAVAQEAPVIARAVEAIAERLRTGGRLIYIGAGTSGRLGVLDASECPPTFNSDPRQVVGIIAGGDRALRHAIEGAEDNPEMGRQDLEAVGLTAADVVVGIATSGRTPYVIGGLRYAQSLGALAIGLTCNTENQMHPVSDLLICPVVGPEVLSGSTRMKAGTATKLVLNSLTTGTMVLLGKTYGNLMVDLRASNSKLIARTARIVCELTGLERAAAEQLLRDCEGRLKTAVVSSQRNVSPQVADELLAAAGQHLRTALHLPLAMLHERAQAAPETSGPAGKTTPCPDEN